MKLIKPGSNPKLRSNHWSAAFAHSVFSKILVDHLLRLKYRCACYGYIALAEQIIVYVPRGSLTRAVIHIGQDGEIEVECFDKAIGEVTSTTHLHMADPDFFEKFKIIFPGTSLFKTMYYRMREVLWDIR